MAALPEKTRVVICAAVLAGAALPACVAAQGSKWPAYGRMSCYELESERRALRPQLARMQQPDALDDPRWTPAYNAYNVVNHFFAEKCRALSAQERSLPAPPQIALLPEKQHVDLAMKAMRNGRRDAGRSFLMQGALAGYPSAQFNLGMLFYLSGQTDASERWLRSAAQQGHPEAAKMLESMRKGKK